jgi:hypothetical protein
MPTKGHKFTHKNIMNGVAGFSLSYNLDKRTGTTVYSISKKATREEHESGYTARREAHQLQLQRI